MTPCYGTNSVQAYLVVDNVLAELLKYPLQSSPVKTCCLGLSDWGVYNDTNFLGTPDSGAWGGGPWRHLHRHCQTLRFSGTPHQILPKPLKPGGPEKLLYVRRSLLPYLVH